jgi:hypothetical protein
MLYFASERQCVLLSLKKRQLALRCHEQGRSVLGRGYKETSNVVSLGLGK